MMRNAVERDGARVVVIDSINGYFAAMPEARFLALQMHELLSFLGARGVATILTIAQSGGVYGPSTVPVDVSYLADSVVLLRYFESFGRVRKAISMLKKRSGMHEDMIRELVLDHGIHVGPALTNFQGVLTGMPMIGGTPGGTPSSEPPPWVAEQVANGH
jgi:circadian clock protein KaiC